jgi:hypothetical protein
MDQEHQADLAEGAEQILEQQGLERLDKAIQVVQEHLLLVAVAVEQEV